MGGLRRLRLLNLRWTNQDDEKQSADHQTASFGVHVDSSLTSLVFLKLPDLALSLG